MFTILASNLWVIWSHFSAFKSQTLTCLWHNPKIHHDPKIWHHLCGSQHSPPCCRPSQAEHSLLRREGEKKKKKSCQIQKISPVLPPPHFLTAGRAEIATFPEQGCSPGNGSLAGSLSVCLSVCSRGCRLGWAQENPWNSSRSWDNGTEVQGTPRGGRWEYRNGFKEGKLGKERDTGESPTARSVCSESRWNFRIPQILSVLCISLGYIPHQGNLFGPNSFEGGVYISLFHILYLGNIYYSIFCI